MIKELLDFYLSKKFFQVGFSIAAILLLFIAFVEIKNEIFIFNPTNEAAYALVSDSEEIHEQLGPIKEINYESRYKKTKTGGATTKFILITSDEKTRYEIKVQIEKDEQGEWYLYSWEILDDKHYNE